MKTVKAWAIVNRATRTISLKLHKRKWRAVEYHYPDFEEVIRVEIRPVRKKRKK